VIDLPLAWVIGLNVVGWPVIQLVLALGFTRLPANWFRPGPGWACEQDGRLYERLLAIRAWKDWLPDAARWLPGGTAKSLATGTTPHHLERFIRETWRGELCHWCVLACAPVFFLWNPWWADVVMVVYAVAANLPCILLQRYNRLRTRRVLARRSHRVQLGTV
jgi:glycosyl-4,4'-diaponeurosporenoate acyltransferase